MDTSRDSIKYQTYLEYQIPSSYKVEWHSDCIPKSPGSLSRASSVKSIPSLISTEICDCSICGDFCKSGCPNGHTKDATTRPLSTKFDSQVESDSDYTSSYSFHGYSRHSNDSFNRHKGNQQGASDKNVSYPGLVKHYAPKSQRESGSIKTNAPKNESKPTYPEYVIKVKIGENGQSRDNLTCQSSSKGGNKVAKLIAGFDNHHSNLSNGTVNKDHHSNNLKANNNNGDMTNNNIKNTTEEPEINYKTGNVNQQSGVYFYESQSDIPESHDASFCSDISESLPSSSEDFANTQDVHASTPVHMELIGKENIGYVQENGYDNGNHDLQNNNKNDGYYGNNDLDIDEDAFVPIPYGQSDEDVSGYNSKINGYHSNIETTVTNNSLNNNYENRNICKTELSNRNHQSWTNDINDEISDDDNNITLQDDGYHSNSTFLSSRTTSKQREKDEVSQVSHTTCQYLFEDSNRKELHSPNKVGRLISNVHPNNKSSVVADPFEKMDKVHVNSKPLQNCDDENSTTILDKDNSRHVKHDETPQTDTKHKNIQARNGDTKAKQNDNEARHVWNDVTLEKVCGNANYLEANTSDIPCHLSDVSLSKTLKENVEFDDSKSFSLNDSELGLSCSNNHSLTSLVNANCESRVNDGRDNDITNIKDDVSYIRDDINKTEDDITNVENITDCETYVGKEVFFRAGGLARLEDSRDTKITGQLVIFQAKCRGYLARKKLQQLKVQHLAVSCIQRNVQKFMGIRDWTWWRLYNKVQPLLNVHRTEEELREREEEAEQLKLKLEKVEKERNQLRITCERLETKLNELTADYAEENATSVQASELLEAENAERMCLEKELRELQAKFNASEKRNYQLEMEVTQTRMWNVSAVDSDEDETDGSIYKDRYDKLKRELQMTRQRLAQEHAEEVDQMTNKHKALERKMNEMIEENDNLHRQVQNLRRKSSRLTQEQNDAKLHLDEQLNRNSDLEKKQRKFDTELNKLTNELKDEKHHREKLQRERDELHGEKYTIDQAYKTLKIETDLQREKLHNLERDLEDMSTKGSQDLDKQILALKRAKSDLEAKVTDQEEELDEQAGTIQQLEQAKLRLEMDAQKLRQQHNKEQEDRDAEIEEMRYSTQKKVKAMEVQLDEEYAEKQSIIREKKELERKLAEMQDFAPSRDRAVEKRLRQDLKRTRALLHDAQTMLEKQKKDMAGKSAIKQLRNQLEDAEFATAAAVKARKSMESEISDLQRQIDDATKSKADTEERYSALIREKNDVLTNLEDLEEEMAEIMKKYKAAVQQHSVDQITLRDQSEQIELLMKEKELLKEQVSTLGSKVDYLEGSTVDKHLQDRHEARIRELESRLQYEETTKQRLESQATRHKQQIESLTKNIDISKSNETQAQDLLKRVQRELRDLREETGDIQARDAESSQRKADLERKVETLEAEYEESQADLKLAFKRIQDLQAVIEEDMDSDLSLTDSEFETDSDLDDSYMIPSPSRRIGSHSSLDRAPPGGSIDLQMPSNSRPIRPIESTRKKGLLKPSKNVKDDIASSNHGNVGPLDITENSSNSDNLERNIMVNESKTNESINKNTFKFDDDPMSKRETNKRKISSSTTQDTNTIIEYSDTNINFSNANITQSDTSIPNSTQLQDVELKSPKSPTVKKIYEDGAFL